MPNIIFLIITCDKYKDRETAIRKTWLPGLGYEYLWVRTKMEIENKWKVDGDTLWVRCPDDYVSLPRKLFLAFQYIYECRQDIETVFKVDDDVYLNTWKFRDNLEQFLEHDYAGFRRAGFGDPSRYDETCGREDSQSIYQSRLYKHYYKRWNYPNPVKYTGIWYAGGYVYWLSRDYIKIILDWFGEDKGIFEIFEDKCWADVFREKKVIGWNLHNRFGKWGIDTHANKWDRENDEFIAYGKCSVKEILCLHSELMAKYSIVSSTQ